MSPDETNKTPDVEPAEPTTGEAAGDEAAAPKKPVARKPAAKKPAAKAKAEKAEAAPKKPARKPAAKKPAAETKPEAAAPAVEAPKEAAEAAAEAPEEAAKKPARKRAPRKAAAEKPEAKPEPKPKRERPAKPAPKAAPEPRHGKAGVATFVGADGAEVETRELSKAVFGVAADVNALHLAVRAEQASRRRGTASTKTRGEISGSTAKLYRQKGTGRARAGSIKSPVRTGGGTVFGPHPRTFDIKVNRKVARKALAMALSNRAENGNVFVAAGLQLDEPSTRTMDRFLEALDIAAPVLVVTHDEPAVLKSVRNLFYAEAAEVGALSTEQVLRARSLVLTEKAFDALNQA